MRSLTRRATLATAAAGLAAGSARADEATRVRVSHGYSTGHLPLMVMREQGLIEKHAAQAGLGKLTVEWQIADGGNNINDAMLAGALDIAGIGIPGVPGAARPDAWPAPGNDRDQRAGFRRALAEHHQPAHQDAGRLHAERPDRRSRDQDILCRGGAGDGGGQTVRHRKLRQAGSDHRGPAASRSVCRDDVGQDRDHLASRLTAVFLSGTRKSGGASCAEHGGGARDR